MGGTTNENGYTAEYGKLHDEEDKKPVSTVEGYGRIESINSC